MWEARVCTGARGNVRSGEGGKERTSCWLLEQRQTNEVNRGRVVTVICSLPQGWFGSGLGP